MFAETIPQCAAAPLSLGCNNNTNCLSSPSKNCCLGMAPPSGSVVVATPPSVMAKVVGGAINTTVVVSEQPQQPQPSSVDDTPALQTIGNNNNNSNLFTQTTEDQKLQKLDETSEQQQKTQLHTLEPNNNETPSAEDDKCATMNAINKIISQTPSVPNERDTKGIISNTQQTHNVPPLQDASNKTVTEQPRRIRANHKRNLSLDFRAMGIELPPLPDVPHPPQHHHYHHHHHHHPIVNRLPKIPEGGNHNIIPTTAPSEPPSVLAPKIRHVLTRILTRRIN